MIIPTLTQIPHPMHKSSDILATLLAGVTSIHSLPNNDRHDHKLLYCGHSKLLPIRFTGQDFLHS